MKIIVALKKEDIQTKRIGANLAIDTGDLMVSLTKDAAEELVSDLKQMLDNYNEETEF